MNKIKQGLQCWICKDNGMVIEEIIHKNLSYEMAYRCSCKEGLKSSEYIPMVTDELAEKLAMDNYSKP